MRSLSFLFIVILFVCIGCEKMRNCGECFTPPDPISFKIIDSISGNNLISPNGFSSDSLQLYYFSDSLKKNVKFEIYGNEVNRRIVSNELSWNSISENNYYYLYLSYKDVNTLFVNTEIITENCCTWHELKDFKINGKTIEYDSNEFVFIIEK